MKIDKVEVCMNGVNAVKDCARNIGMVCENCGFLEESSGSGVYRNYCRKIESDTPRDGFCYLFHFRDEKACAAFWNKVHGEDRPGRRGEHGINEDRSHRR